MSDENLSKFEKLKKKMMEFDINVNQILIFSLKKELVNESRGLVRQNERQQPTPKKN